MTGQQQTLAQMVRAKFPGVYNDMTDQQLEAAVVAKFPGAYDDIPKTGQSAAPAQKQRSGAQRDTISLTSGAVRQGLTDVAVGAGKGALDTAVNLGRLVHKIPGVSKAVDALYGGDEGLSARSFDVAHEALEPTNTAQRIGRFAEKTAELAIPAAKVATATKGAGVLTRAGAQAGTAAGVTAAQGGSPQDVAVAAGLSGVASPVADAASAIKRGLTDVLPEKLYAQVFRYADDDLMREYRNIAKGRPAAPTLRREMLERGVMGTSEDMAVYSLQKLDALESQLQNIASRKVLVLPKKAEYIAQLDDLSKQFSGGFFGERAAEAAALRDALKKMPGPSARATDMLKVKRFLDGMRNTSSFRLDPNLTAKQEELKIAADLIRSTLHKQPQLSPLINEERVFINAVDAIVADGVRRGNKSVFGIVDAALSSAGPQGMAGAMALRGAQRPRAMTGLAQALYRFGKATPDPAGGVRGFTAAVLAGKR